MNFNNLIIGIRNIRKNWIYSVINVVGLSLGIAVTMLILFWVADELNFDRFHKNLNRIYTIVEHQVYSGGQDLYTPCTPFPLSQELAKNYPEVEKATTFTDIGNQFFRYGEKMYKEGPVYSTDNEFLNIFSFRIIEGDKNALKSPDKMIIDEEIARLFFGKGPAVGKILKINNQLSLTVGAVMETQKENSTLKFKILLPIDYLKSRGVEFSNWGNNWPRTTVLLAEGMDAKQFGTKIASLCKKKGQENTVFSVFPFKKERLYSFSDKNNQIQYIYQFIGIAFIIIIIASINFINLSTVKADQRRSEIGVRKILGAGKSTILKLFVMEKGMMIFISFIVGSMLILGFLPLFNTVADKHITIGLFQNRSVIFIILLVISIVVFISVLYPSLQLSSFSPAVGVKKAGSTKVAGISLKSLLVVVQFVFSIILISSTIVITKQLKYIHNYDLGYNQSNLVYLSLEGEAKNKYDAIAQELKQMPGVANISLTNNLPFYGNSSSWGYNWEGKDPQTKMLITEIQVDRNYFKTMGINFMDGTTFPNTYNSVIKSNEVSSPQVILNKEAIRRMNMKNPVGKFFGTFNGRKGNIAGVVDNFHFQSLHRGVEPLLITPLDKAPDNIIVRIHARDFSQTIENIKKSWHKIVPQATCEIGFFDESLKKLYTSEVRISGLFNYFSFIAIFISSLGLFGLSLFIIERRTKEIGVRKVNGARVSGILVTLNYDFIVWIAIAFIIAGPIAWYATQKWLQNFAYKTTLNWWVFIAAGGIVLTIALLTVSWQSWRAATRNPVEALRYE